MCLFVAWLYVFALKLIQRRLAVEKLSEGPSLVMCHWGSGMVRVELGFARWGLVQGAVAWARLVRMRGWPCWLCRELSTAK